MVSGVVYTFERTYFDVRVLDPHALSNRHANLHSVYREHKQIKKSAYEQRIREVEHATFLPLLPEAWPGRPTPFTPSPVYAPPSRPSEVQDSREDMPSKCQWWSTELIPNHIFTSGKGGSAVQKDFDCARAPARGPQRMCAKRQKQGSAEPKEPLHPPLLQTALPFVHPR